MVRTEDYVKCRLFIKDKVDSFNQSYPWLTYKWEYNESEDLGFFIIYLRFRGPIYEIRRTITIEQIVSTVDPELVIEHCLAKMKDSIEQAFRRGEEST